MEMSEGLRGAVSEYERVCDLKRSAAEIVGDVKHAEDVLKSIDNLLAAHKSELWRAAEADGMTPFMAEVIAAWIERSAGCRRESWEDDLKWSRRALTPMRIRFQHTFPGHEELRERLQAKVPVPFDERFAAEAGEELERHLGALFPKIEWLVTTAELVGEHVLEIDAMPVSIRVLGVQVDFTFPYSNALTPAIATCDDIVCAVAKCGDHYISAADTTELGAVASLVDQLCSLKFPTWGRQ